jgi:hypothetical protein
MKRISIAVSVILLLAVVVFAKGTTTKPKIGREQARATALAKAPGKIQGEELEREKGMLVWSFDIRGNDRKITEVWVDANSGKVVRTEIETTAHERAEQQKEKAEQQKKQPVKH